MSSAPTQALGGREGRTARSRRAICEACLDLVQEGVLQPSAEQVADRAGLSRRSIFNHFTDLAELYDAVAEAGLERCAPLLEEVDAELPLAERIERLVAVHSRFLEAASGFTRALTAQALVGPASDQAIRVSRQALRLQHRDVERLFEAELRRLAPGARAEVREALFAALAPLQWEFLRRSRGNSIPRARGVLRRTLRSILDATGIGPGT